MLGPVAVETTAGLVLPRGQRLVDLVAVLAQRRGRSVPPEVILDLVWGDAAPGLTTAVVHSVVARLRRQPGVSALVETDVNGYRLSAGAAVDAHDHEQLVRRARELSRAGRTDEAIASLRSALELWTGPTAYEGASDDIVLGDRARLEESRVTATELLASFLVAGGTPVGLDEAWGLAQQLVADFPLREAPCRLAMTAAYGLGRQEEALQAYARLRSALREELGIEPSPETQQVHAQVLAHQLPMGEHRSGMGKGAPFAPGSSRLPVPSTPTIGREGSLALLSQWLGDGHRLITLVGPAGVGKSRLLHELGRVARTGATAYVDLSALDGASAGEVASAISLEFRLGTSGSDPVTGLAMAMARARVLVLADEAERAAGAVAVIARTLLERAPGVTMVVTSRVPLGVVGERVLHVSPLDCPDAGDDVATTRSSPAVRLLEARLRDHAPDLALDDAWADLAMLAREVDGLPLGLELLAAQASTRSLRDLTLLLPHRLDVEDVPGRGASRHRTLREAATWSLARLEPTQRQVFRRISVFAGSFSPEAAKVVVGHPDTEVVLRQLAKDAVLQLDRRGPRVQFRMLRTMRDLAHEMLVAASPAELELVRERHRAWFAGRWRDCSFTDAMLVDVRDTYDDHIQALEASLEARDVESVASLGVTLGWYWVFNEVASTPWLRRILAAGVLSARDQARIALLQRSLDESVRPAPEGPTASAMADLLADDPEWSVLTGIVDSIADYLEGQVGSARERAESLIEASAQGAAHLLPEVLGTVAVMRAAAGAQEAALTAAEEAWRLLGPDPGVIQLNAVASKVGLALLDSGYPNRALAILTDAVASDERQGMPPSGTLLINAGWAALDVGDSALALQWFNRVLDRGTGLLQFLLTEAVAGAAVTLSRRGAEGATHHLAAAAELCCRQGVPAFPRLAAELGDVDIGSARSLLVATRDDELVDSVIDAVRTLGVTESGDRLGP